MLSQLSCIGSHNTLFSSFLSLGLIWDIPQCIHRETGRAKRRIKVWVIHSLLTHSDKQPSEQFEILLWWNIIHYNTAGNGWLLEHLLQDDNRPRDLAESKVSHFQFKDLCFGSVCIVYPGHKWALYIRFCDQKYSHNFSFQCLGRTNANGYQWK